MEKAKKVGLIVAVVLIVLFLIVIGIFFFRSSTQRTIKDIQSEYTGGLNRTLNVYSYDGKKIASYEGKIDIAENLSGTVKFQLKGKRYIYYNALVEVIEK